mmetsp:Transcript_27202/g.43179  ORF Transcript_27202/g.43179 Transcript_27202/m.43179 type:complete len:216 (-) Transcript_27202:78-725(-)
MIGTSLIVLHRHRTMISKPILNPIGFMRSPLAKTSFVVQKNPDIGSVEPLRGHASNVAPALMTLRWKAQAATPPPGTFRDPTLNSAFFVRTGSATAGTDSGSCCRSASIQSIVSYFAFEKPSNTAELNPLPTDLSRTCMRTGYLDFKSSTIPIVASVPLLSSSNIRSSASNPALAVALNKRVHSSSMFSYSSYVGTITESCLVMPQNFRPEEMFF